MMLAIVVVVVAMELAAANQRLCVKGKVACSTDPVYTRGQIVKLWDEDEGPDPDDMMAENVTDSDGFFHLCGSGYDRFSHIDPIFKVYTKCNNPDETDEKCFRKLRFPINQNHIGSTYEFPEEIDISQRIANEARRCFTGNKLNDFFKKYTGNTYQEWFAKFTGDGEFMKSIVEKTGTFIKETVGLDETPSQQTPVEARRKRAVRFFKKARSQLVH